MHNCIFACNFNANSITYTITDVAHFLQQFKVSNNIFLHFNSKKLSIPITFKNLIKACFSNKKYIISIQTCTSQLENNAFLIENSVHFFVAITTPPFFHRGREKMEKGE